MGSTVFPPTEPTMIQALPPSDDDGHNEGLYLPTIPAHTPHDISAHSPQSPYAFSTRNVPTRVPNNGIRDALSINSTMPASTMLSMSTMASTTTLPMNDSSSLFSHSLSNTTDTELDGENIIRILSFSSSEEGGTGDVAALAGMPNNGGSYFRDIARGLDERTSSLHNSTASSMSNVSHLSNLSNASNLSVLSRSYSGGSGNHSNNSIHGRHVSRPSSVTNVTNVSASAITAVVSNLMRDQKKRRPRSRSPPPTIIGGGIENNQEDDGAAAAGAGRGKGRSIFGMQTCKKYNVRKNNHFQSTPRQKTNSTNAMNTPNSNLPQESPMSTVALAPMSHCKQEYPMQRLRLELDPLPPTPQTPTTPTTPAASLEHQRDEMHHNMKHSPMTPQTPEPMEGQLDSQSPVTPVTSLTPVGDATDPLHLGSTKIRANTPMHTGNSHGKFLTIETTPQPPITTKSPNQSNQSHQSSQLHPPMHSVRYNTHQSPMMSPLTPPRTTLDSVTSVDHCINADNTDNSGSDAQLGLGVPHLAKSKNCHTPNDFRGKNEGHRRSALKSKQMNGHHNEHSVHFEQTPMAKSSRISHVHDSSNPSERTPLVSNVTSVAKGLSARNNAQYVDRSPFSKTLQATMLPTTTAPSVNSTAPATPTQPSNPAASTQSTSPKTYLETHNHKEAFLLSLLFFFLWTPQNLLAPNLTAAALDFHFDDDTTRDLYLGSNLALASSVLSLPFSGLIGFASDMVSRRILVILTGIIGGIAAICTGMAHTYTQLILARFIGGACMSGSVPVVFSLLSDWFEDEDRNAASSGFTAMMGAGIILGQVYAGSTGPTLGWRHSFFISGWVTIGMALLVCLFIQEPVRGGKERVLREMLAGGRRYEKKLTWSQFYQAMIHHSSNGIILLQGFFSNVPWGVMFVFLNDYLSQEKGLTVPDATFLVAIFGIGCAAGGILGGYFGSCVSRWDRSYLPLFMAGTTFLGILPFLALLDDGSYHEAGAVPCLYACLAGCLASLPSVNVRPCLINVNPPEIRGAALTAANLIINSARGAGPTFLTTMMSLWGIDRAYGFNILIILFWTITSIQLLILSKTLPSDQDRMETELAIYAMSNSSSSHTNGTDYASIFLDDGSISTYSTIRHDLFSRCDTEHSGHSGHSHTGSGHSHTGYTESVCAETLDGDISLFSIENQATSFDATAARGSLRFMGGVIRELGDSLRRKDMTMVLE